MGAFIKMTAKNEDPLTVEQFGINEKNVEIVYRISRRVLETYVPGRQMNAINLIFKGDKFLIIPKRD